MPLEPVALLMAVTVSSEELQVTEAVRFFLVPSEKVPVAKNCCGMPRVVLALIGVTMMDMSVSGVTVRVVEPEIVPAMG
jgi:hypothetical protein